MPESDCEKWISLATDLITHHIAITGQTPNSAAQLIFDQLDAECKKAALDRTSDVKTYMKALASSPTPLWGGP